MADDEVAPKMTAIKKGGAEKYHIKLKEKGKLFVRERL